MLTLTKLSETSTKITLGWTPPADAQCYVFYADGVRITQGTPTYEKDFPSIGKNKGDPRDQVVFSKGGEPYEVAALCRNSTGVFRVEVGTYAAAPPPPPSAKKFTRKSDFGYFFNGQGCSEITTPHGDGLKFMADTTMPAPWEFNSKICQGAELDERVTHPQAGDHTLWTWHMRFPSADNPNGFNTGWWGHNILMEFGTTGGSVGHEFTMNTDGTCSFFVREAAGQFPTRKYTTAQPVPLDAWIPVTWDIKWSYGTDGMMKGSIGGVQLLDRTGPTMWDGERVRHLGIGWYAVKQLRNAVEFAAMQYALL